MAYDRYETRRDRWREDEDRGFFEKAGDEIASWFGDEEAERRRRRDERMNRDHDWSRDRGRYAMGGWGDRSPASTWDRGDSRDWNRDRYDYRSYAADRDDYRTYGRDRDRDRWGSDHDRDFTSRERVGSWSRDPMPNTGSYGYARSFGPDRDYGSRFDRSPSVDRDDYRTSGFGGATRETDRHYQAWRQRQLDELDRDYDHYCRERQNRFESDFGSWRKERMSRRRQLGEIREHMDVVGSDGEAVGKVDKVRGDHILLTKSDSDDNRHHSFDCSLIQAVEGDEVRLRVPAEEAKSRMTDEDTSLERSFSGTYSS